MNAEVRIRKRVKILKCCENCTSSDVEFAIRKVFHVILADTAPSFKASDSYLLTLDGLKVDENVN